MRGYAKEIFISFIVFIVFFVIWIFGASSLFIHIPFFPDFWLNVFQNRSELENIFSPVASFFSGISAFGTTILIYLQIKLNKKQEQDVRRNIFENQIGQMFLMKNEIIKSLAIKTSFGEEFRERQVFEFLYEIFYYLMDKYIDSEELKKKNISFQKFKSSKNIKSIIDDIELFFGILYKDDKNGNISIKKIKVYLLLYIIEKHINEKFKYILTPFYHNVYTILKMIRTNNEISETERLNYMRMFRSQFTQYEFAMIYFHALVFHEKKFKILIEDTCFFHSLMEGFIFINITEKNFPGFGYKETAFKHN